MIYYIIQLSECQAVFWMFFKSFFQPIFWRRTEGAK